MKTINDEKVSKKPKIDTKTTLHLLNLMEFLSAEKREMSEKTKSNLVEITQFLLDTYGDYDIESNTGCNGTITVTTCSKRGAIHLLDEILLFATDTRYIYRFQTCTELVTYIAKRRN